MSFSPTPSKKQKLDDSDVFLSQSEVAWTDGKPENCESPRIIGRNYRSANSLALTPVRVMKRHVSSPLIHTKAERKSHSAETRGFNPTIQENENSDEFLFNFDSDNELTIRKEENKESQRSIELPSSSASLLQNVIDFNLDDSFDDEILNSIPLDALLKKSSSYVPPVVSRQTQHVPVTKPVPETKSKPLARTNSLPTTSTHQPQSIVPQMSTQEAKKLCTKEEIAEKRRIALERLRKSQQRLKSTTR